MSPAPCRANTDAAGVTQTSARTYDHARFADQSVGGVGFPPSNVRNLWPWSTERLTPPSGFIFPRGDSAAGRVPIETSFN